MLLGEQGWRKVVRALASHQFGSDSVPARRHKRVEFVVSSRVAPKVFLPVLRFSFLFTWMEDPLEH